MAEIIQRERRRVLLAQTLKPPTETRLFEKLFASFFSDNQAVSCFILGKFITEKDGFNSHLQRDSVIPFFKKLPGWGGRLHFQAQFVQALFSIKPNLIVVASPELLPLALYYSWFSGSKVVWDVQENYGLNWRSQRYAHRFFFQKPGDWVWYILKKLGRFCDGLILAEAIYDKEFNHFGKPKLVLENKVPESWNHLDFPSQEVQSPYFLFSGVVTRESGIEKAIAWMDQWVKENSGWRLMICGYCPDNQLLKELEALLSARTWVDWVGGNQWVESRTIRQYLLGCSAILMPYFETEANFGKRPTKWFESRWASRPALVNRGGHFSKLEGCIEVDFNNFNSNDSNEIKDRMKAIENQEDNDLLKWTFAQKKCKAFFDLQLNGL